MYIISSNKWQEHEAVGLLKGMEYSRVRGMTWINPYLFVTTRTAVGLADVHENYSTSLE